MSTAISEAMMKAGYNPSYDRLALAATNILQRFSNSPDRAIGRFLEMIEIDRELRRALALEYLRDRAADMRGDSLPGGGQRSDVPHAITAPSRQSHEDGAGQGPCADAKRALPASSSLNADREGQKVVVERARPLLPSRSAPHADGGGQVFRANKAIVSLPPPSAPRGLSAIASIQPAIARSVLDTFKVRDGRSVGDLSWHELSKLARTNEREARVLRLIEGHVANADPTARVRDVVTARVVEEAIKVAEAVNDD